MKQAASQEHTPLPLINHGDEHQSISIPYKWRFKKLGKSSRNDGFFMDFPSCLRQSSGTPVCTLRCELAGTPFVARPFVCGDHHGFTGSTAKHSRATWEAP